MNEDEPVVPVSAPEPPEHLTEQEADKFREAAHKLARMRVMSEADVDALAMYAVSWCRYLEANARVREMGQIVAAPKTKTPMQNPYLSVANKAQETCLKILAEFGLTPSSRTRVNRG